MQALGCKRSERLVPKIAKAKVQSIMSRFGVFVSLSLSHRHSFSDTDSDRDLTMTAVRIIRIAIYFVTSGSQCTGMDYGYA